MLNTTAPIHLQKDVYRLKRENNARRRHAMTFSCLGKLAGTDRKAFRRWKSRLTDLLTRALKQRPLSGNPLVIGLAESGIIPSALFHQILCRMDVQAGWICSTRRPAPGIRFVESHSHGPEHILPFPPERPGELWFVEDEITTGRTLLHLSLDLCRCLNLKRVRYFAFVDTRSPHHHLRFRTLLRNRSIDFSTHTLFSPDRFPCDPVLEDVNDMNSPSTAKSVDSVPAGGAASGWHLPWLRPALCSQPPRGLKKVSAFGGLTGSLLAVGEAVDLALPLVQANPGLHLRHITLSPWEIDQRSIFDRLDIPGGYYLYNPHWLRPPLHLLYDPIDAPVGEAVASLLFESGYEKGILHMPGRRP